MMVFLISMGVRLLAGYALYAVYGFPIGSSIEHRIALAQNLINQHTFAYHGVICLYQTPVYPAFLALLMLLDGFGWLSLTFAQSLLDSLSAVLLQRIGDTFAGRPTWAGLLYAAYPLGIIHSSAIVDTIPALFLAVLVLYLFLRYLNGAKLHYLWLSGVALGIGVLNRPIGIGLLLGMLFLLFQKERFRAVWKMVLTVLIVFTPVLLWSMRNATYVDAFPVITTGSGHFLWFSHNRYVKQVWLEGLSPDVIGRDTEYIMDPTYHADDFMSASPKRQLEMSREGAAAAKQYISDHPSLVLEYTLIKAVRYFLWGYVLEGKQKNPGQFLRENVMEVYGAVIYLLGFVGMILLWKNNRTMFWFFFLIIMSIAAVNIGYQFVNRHKVYHEMLLIVLSSYTLSRLSSMRYNES